MLENTEYMPFSGSTQFFLSPQNTSCTGGTVTNMDESSTSYILTVKELRSCNGFDHITQEKAETIIQGLAQLSALCYRAIQNE